MAKTHARFEDVYGLDAEVGPKHSSRLFGRLTETQQLLALVPQPVKALLLIYPITDEVEKRRKEDDEKLKTEGVAPDVDTSVIWIQQKVRQ